MVTLLQRLLREPVPTFGTIDRARHLHRDIKVAALNSKVEARVLVLDEVERDLRQTNQWY